MLIVDDEFEIREGLRKRIPWQDYGVEEVFAADDGDTALLLALDRKPDLILTDIKMSRMSGLEFLASLCHTIDDPWKAVVISGYDDFELVKQAMRLGAMDYILKPINTDELNGIVRRAADQIALERTEKMNQSQMRSQMQLAEPKLREELLRELVEHEYDPYKETRFAHRLQALKLEWMGANPHLLMIVEADDLKAIANRRTFANEKELVLFGIGNVVNQTIGEEFVEPFALFRDSLSRWVAVFSCGQPDSVQRVKSLADVILRRINEFVKVKASIGIASAPKMLKLIHELYMESGEMLEQKIIYGGNRVFSKHGGGADNERMEPSLYEPGEVIDLVRYGSDEEIVASMNGFVDMVQSWGYGPLKDIQQQIFKWLMGIFRQASAAGWPDRSWERNPILIWDRLEQYDQLESLREQAEEYLLAMAADFRKLPSTPSQIVRVAEKIIRARYAENLSLQIVADEVHVTPVWLSKLFKKEKKRTFLDDLTDVRIAKAKEMLGDIQHKIYQISYLVGYKDPVHFTKLFKKQTGITPKEYRRQRGITDE
ncbi:response regulator transcription factor [Cohnella terricola]|uniref:response regulator transcription factor n=1 Tax=Cohnella terricola TaxID=1289167 RepID=UPI001FEC38D8|nr:response regulator [Cohnella terricola]